MARKKKKGTKLDELKAKVIAIARERLEEQREEINSGIEEGIYEEADNVETLAQIEENLKLVDAFEAEKADVYIFVEGGNIQGASANCNAAIEIYDKDNYNEATSDERKEMGDPDEWNDWIKKETVKGNLIPIY